MKYLAICSLILLLAAPAKAQAPASESDFQNLFSGKSQPITLKLKDLTPEWRHVIIESTEGSKSGGSDMLSQLMQAGMMSDSGKNNKDDSMSALFGMIMLGGMFGKGSGEIPSYTRGLTTNIGGEVFLITYRATAKENNFMDMIMDSAKNKDKEPDFSKLAADSKFTADTELTLTLINVRHIGKLSSIRPFDLNLEISENSKGNSLLDLINSEKKKKPDTSKQDKSDEEDDSESSKPSAKAKLSPKLTAFHDSVVKLLESDASLKKAGCFFALDITSESSMELYGVVPNTQLKARAENLIRKEMKQKGLSIHLANNVNIEAPAGKE